MYTVYIICSQVSAAPNGAVLPLIFRTFLTPNVGVTFSLASGLATNCQLDIAIDTFGLLSNRTESEPVLAPARLGRRQDTTPL